jgi:hypothetical protein
VNEGEHKRGELGGVVFWLGKRKIYQISYQNDRGKEIRESARTTDEKQALKLLKQRRQSIITAQTTGTEFEAPKLRRQTIAKCLDAWETQCKLQNRWNDCYKSDKKQLLLRFGGMRVEQLTKSVFQQYQLEQKQGLDERRSRGRNAKMNRHLVIVSAAIKISGATPAFAKEMKDLRLEEPPAREGYFTIAEFGMLLSALPDDIADVAEALWLTGWRLSEVIGKVILGKFRPGVLWSEKHGNSLMLPAQRNKGRASQANSGHRRTQGVDREAPEVERSQSL